MASMVWGYARIIVGTLGGGALGFYVMHRIEVGYKMKMEEALRQYELKKKQEEEVNLGHMITEESV